jgi:hypothetical protein
MIKTVFTVGNSVFTTRMYPGLPRKGDRVVIDGVDFVVKEDGIVHLNFPFGGSETTRVEAKLDVPDWH